MPPSTAGRGACRHKKRRELSSAPLPGSSSGWLMNYFFFDDLPVGTVAMVCKMRLQIL